MAEETIDITPEKAAQGIVNGEVIYSFEKAENEWADARAIAQKKRTLKQKHLIHILGFLWK